jgi:hypothetical protein
MWPGGQADVDDRASARNLVAVSLQLALRIRDVLRVLDGEQPLRQ